MSTNIHTHACAHVTIIIKEDIMNSGEAGGEGEGWERCRCYAHVGSLKKAYLRIETITKRKYLRGKYLMMLKKIMADNQFD